MSQEPPLRSSHPLPLVRRAAIVAAALALTVVMVYSIAFPLNGLTPDEGYDMGDTADSLLSDMRQLCN